MPPSQTARPSHGFTTIVGMSIISPLSSAYQKRSTWTATEYPPAATNAIRVEGPKPSHGPAITPRQIDRITQGGGPDPARLDEDFIGPSRRPAHSDWQLSR